MSTLADKRPITPYTSGRRTLCPMPLQKRGRSCMPLASPSPSSTNIAALLSRGYVRERIPTHTEQLKLTRRTPLIFEFYFGRLLTESKRIAATYRRDQEACGDEARPCQPHATPGSSSCPDGGGRGVSPYRCAAPCGNAACAVPRRLHLARCCSYVRPSCGTH